ncbi:MAG: TonB-dependent receptor [Deltaproteobacteria bacterium]|jgi:iron complex outermembrane receptor protein|nr:TonB-dependent receptor [Deltaproteobacteria bacterium]
MGLIISLLSIGFQPSITLAQNPTLISTEADNLAAIEVNARNRRQELQSTTAVVIDNRDFSERVILSPLEAVRFIPGISMVGYNEGGVPWDIKIRGFTGGHFSGVSFSLDGVQLNGPNGNFDANFINPLDIENVEVVKGPSSIYFGLNAMGGSVAYSSIKQGDFTRLKLRYGSYNDIYGAGVIARTIGRFDHVYSFQVAHTDGWRDHSAGDKHNLSASWQFHPDEKLTIGLNLRAYNYNWDQAGFLWSREAVPPKTAYNDDNGGQASREFVRLWADYKLSDNALLSFQGFYTQLDFTRYQRMYRNLLWGNGNENNTKSDNFGFRAMYNYSGQVSGRDLALALGAEWMAENQRYIEWSFLPGTGRTRGNIANKWHNNLKAWSLFGEVNYQVLEPLWARLGLRYDSYGGDRTIQSGAQAGQKVKAERREALSPKVGLLFRPLENLEFFANYGKTYDLPAVAGGDFFTRPDMDMPVSQQFELGVKVAPVDWLTLGTAFFHIDTENDLMTNVVTRRLENIGQTRRLGLEFSAEATFLQNWRAMLNYTYQEAKYKNTNRFFSLNNTPVDYNLDGRWIDDTPRHIFNALLAYQPESGLGGRLSFWWYGHMVRNDFPIEQLMIANRPDYNLKKPPTTSLDLQLNWSFNETYKLTLDVMNLFDHRNYGFAAPTPMPAGGYVYSLQPPRTVYLGLEANWK